MPVERQPDLSHQISEGLRLLSCCLVLTCILLSCQEEASTSVVDMGSVTAPSYEDNIDHAGLLGALDEDAYRRGRLIYRSSCFNCHGDPSQQGSMPQAHKFWEDGFTQGDSPFELYQTLTHGTGLMPAQVNLVPRQKYDVIHFLREEYFADNDFASADSLTGEYLASLPKGDTIGPPASKWQPWKEADYGNFLFYTYEIADSSAAPKVISGGRAPLANEDYRDVNFAYKGIAIRLDEGPGGVSDGEAFVVFDHDLMRIAGFWTGKGFIDWDGILFNDRHNIYPRIHGDLHIENEVAPGWAEPTSGSWDDPRFTAVDGRKFGPLPHSWAQYRGLLYADGKPSIHYTVGNTKIYEAFDVHHDNGWVFSRSMQVLNNPTPLKVRLWPTSIPTKVRGDQVKLVQEDDTYFVQVPQGDDIRFEALCGRQLNDDQLSTLAKSSVPNLAQRKPSHAHYPERLTSPLVPGNNEAPYAVDVLSLPLSSPWNAQFRSSGIDFIDDDHAVVCTVDGDVFLIRGITKSQGTLSWQRIASGLFQPLGIKVVDDKIYVSCRDQIVRLHDLNGDFETDYYEAFNSDHQVTEHFHEFAMGLQTDEAGNFYYAKSGRHARTSLVPQHGTLLKVSKDGSSSDILASGFRAANGVCINDDGTFYVTDQEGFWLPMNRINRVVPGEGKFYGNMWGYEPPADSSDDAMEDPLVWVDSKYDRSPAELLWVDSDQWGPLNGELLSTSYGYGKVFVVMQQSVMDIEQGALVRLPIPSFPTGFMRARFHPSDGQLYGCGMMAWATSQVMQAGGIYRIRYTGEPLYLADDIAFEEGGIRLQFSEALKSSVRSTDFEVNTWQLKRSRRYGSDRLDEKTLEITNIDLDADGKGIRLNIPSLQESWIVEIKYDLEALDGEQFSGAIQGSIFALAEKNPG